MRRCSSGWCRCGCSMTSWWRRECGSPTRWAAAVTRPGAGAGGSGRALVPRMVKLPWIPGEPSGCRSWRCSGGEPVRNRVMLALAYDAALRREELCSLRTDDLDPAHRTLRVRAETTKTRRERVVPYSAPTGVLLSDYLRAPGRDQPGAGPAVLVGVAAQPRRAAELVDLVEGGPPGRAGRRGVRGSPPIRPGICA